VRASLLIARSVLIEAVRRREVYAIVLLSLMIIAAVMTVDFFKVEGLTKFYREVALKLMSMATALTVVVLAARQLPREFEHRTIYPLLAKPVSRGAFLAGKLIGVLLAAAFCLLLFLAVYVGGSLYLGLPVPWAIFGQYFHLQMVMMLVLASMCFLLSLMMNLDAAITIGALFYFTSSILMSATMFLYPYSTPAARTGLLALNYLLPQLELFDLGDKAVHAEAWAPLSAGTLAALTLYGSVFAAVYMALAQLLFRRRPL
jgi:Cu-processing system permease protein